MNKQKLNILIERFKQDNTSPKIELNSVNSYTLLVAVILSAQATDISVNKATPKLFAIANNPAAMIELGEAKLKEYIKSIGLFNNKAKNIIAMSNILIDQYNGSIPKTRAELEQLPGVGRKTANVILYNVFGIPTIAVDTHVFRVSNRVGLCNTKTPLATEMALIKIFHKKHLGKLHHWLVLHGRYICKAKKPLCNKCIISDLCQFKHIK